MKKFKLTKNTTNLLHETFFSRYGKFLLKFATLTILFQKFGKIFLYVYQHNGLPCGWKGDYPEGKNDRFFLMNKE